MFRDKGPIHNIGHGVSSRDAPTREGETETPSPNSGYIGRALDDHPVMRFLGSAASAMLVTTIASKFTKQGGLRLGQALQKSSDYQVNSGRTDALSTRLVRSITDLRRGLDEYQGVSRSIDGVDDPYKKVVYDVDGKLTTGYEGKSSEMFGFAPLSKEGQRTSGRGITSENAEAWVYKDELQKRMIRAGRRLPYELPALYVAQRAVTEPLFGHNQDRRQINWYNPADVISDFVKQSVVNVATMTLPFEALGAAGTAGRSSLTTLANSMNDLNSLSPIQKKSASIAVDLRSLLSEVGQDLTDITNKALRISSQTSGAFSSGIQEMQGAQPEFVQALYSARRGSRAAIESLDATHSGKIKKSAARARGFFVGDGSYEYGAADLIPSLRGIGVGFEAAKNNFKALGVAHDVVSGKLSKTTAESVIASKFNFSTLGIQSQAVGLNRDLNKFRGLVGRSPEEILERAVNQVQSQHSSSLTRFAQGFHALGKGGPTSEKFTSSNFYQGEIREEYRKQLEKNLIISKGIDRKSAASFVSQINIPTIPSGRTAIDVTKRISLGRKSDFAETQDEFFDGIITKFRQIKGGKNFEEAIGSGSALRQSIEEVDSLFLSQEFRSNLNQKIASNWNSFYKGNLATQASQVLKPSKQSFSDFIGDISEEKKSYLTRKTAQTIGVPLQKADGTLQTESMLRAGLRAKGIDPSNAEGMRDYLFNQGKLSTGFFKGGANILGLRPVLVDEGMDRGLFNYLPETQQGAIRQIASAQATFDPVTGGLGAATQTMGQSAIKGVYQTRNGEILDFTKVTSLLTRAKDFLATDLKVPIVGFNPADMFGYRSLSDMKKSQSLQYVSARSVQPFIPAGEKRPDFYIFNRTKSTKGTLTSFARNEQGKLESSQLAGMYRGASSASTEIISREARNASGLFGERVDALGDQPAKFSRFKRMFDIDPEQPNSIFRLAGRFRDRNTDIRNPRVLSEMLGSEEGISSTRGLRGVRSARLSSPTAPGQTFQVLDSQGSELFNQSSILRAIEGFRKRAFNFNIDRKVMQALEDDPSGLFTSSGVRSSQIFSDLDVRGAVRTLAEDEFNAAATLRRSGIDPRALNRSFSRIERLLDQDKIDVNKASSEIFRYIAQKNELLRQTASIGSTTVNQGDDIFTQISKTIRQLQSEGKIGIDQAAEARAFGVATLFNFSSFKSYASGAMNTEDATASLSQLLKTTRDNREAASLFEAFSSGQISMINSGIRRPMSRLIPPLSQRFGTAPYEIDDLSVNVLGSGQQSTFIPTFGTAFARNPMKAMSSVAGFGTYKNQEAFSTASIPMSHMFGRLNKYFGTFGMQLDQSQYGGPVDLYMRGMVMKRALPITVAGTTALAADRTIGGMVNEKDERGERVYSPFFTTKLARGAVEAQSVGAGLVPGGMSYEEKKDQLLNGEVAVRQGRYWPLGTTPFKGGKVMYYRPSYYRKLAEGSAYTSDSYESPIEKLMYGYDFSPLRPFDPYRFERKHYEDRPYPLTGEYFSGPFGPAVPLLNMTVGKLLKPQMEMHSEQTAAGLANYVAAGDSGAYNISGFLTKSPTLSSSMQGVLPSNYGPTIGQGTFSSGGYGGGAGLQIGSYNSRMSSSSGPMATAANSVRSQIGGYNNSLSESATYGPPRVSGVIPPSIVPAGAPGSTGSLSFQGSELAYRLQETAGIYGFAFGSLRSGLGFGNQDFEPQRPMLQSATKGYSGTRSFWDLNLGGLGDVPMAGEGSLGNIEISEIVRRFIPKERSTENQINPIQNTMGQQYPFLPGAEYFNNFKTGDPFTKISEGEIRLPGVAYERFNTLYSDETGRYGRVNQLDILADVAPYSSQFRSLNRTINMGNLDPGARQKVQEIRLQAEEMTSKYQFSPYKYKGTTPEEMNMNPKLHMINRAGEYIAHRDTFFNTKFLNRRTATEDWERRNVYGATFPEWQRPYESFIEPMLNKASQRNPIVATAALATAGSFFGRTPGGKAFGSIVGGTAGFVSSVKGNIQELVTGQRSMPEKRKKEIALEEYVDILSYVKNTSLAAKAQAAGDANAAASYKSAAKRTMYGADIYGASVDTLSLAVPKRKREHFKAMIEAPEEERERILSTAGRLERRIYQAAWGQRVEEKPDLAEYFSRHELPGQHWEGWHPNTNMEHVKIKMGQSMGLEMSQMGYYPQQINEANLTNPSYPSFFDGEKEETNAAQLRAMMSRMGVSGSVTPVVNPFGSNSVNISAGVR